MRAMGLLIKIRKQKRAINTFRLTFKADLYNLLINTKAYLVNKIVLITIRYHKGFFLTKPGLKTTKNG
jgi:hypothetical protein